MLFDLHINSRKVLSSLPAKIRWQHLGRRAYQSTRNRVNAEEKAVTILKKEIAEKALMGERYLPASNEAW